MTEFDGRLAPAKRDERQGGRSEANGRRTASSDSDVQTAALGEDLGRTLHPGDVVLLYGDLGAGKTAFVRGMARGMGANPDEVTSPTFTIVQEYAGPSATLYHVDLYRLEGPEIDDLGLEDLIAGDGIVAIEWADRWNGRPDDTIEVRIKDAGEDQRSISIQNPNREPRTVEPFKSPSSPST